MDGVAQTVAVSGADMSGSVAAERDRWPRAVAVTAVACWSLGLGGLVVALASGDTDVSWPDLAVALAYPAVALLVAHVRDARGWSALTLVSALAAGLNVASTSWADRAYAQHPVPTGGAAWAAWAEGWSWVVSIVGYCAIAVFPDGRLPSRRWRVAPAALVAGGGLIALGNAVRPRIDEYGIPNPMPGPHPVAPPAVGAVATGLALVGLLGCLACVVVKFRRADPVGRRQIGWYGYGYAVTLVMIVLAVATNLPSAVLAVGPVAVAAGAGIGILRYRLYDIDRVVNRTLAWGLLTALVVALYAICVGFSQRLFDGSGTAGGLVATAVVAVAFQPLRTSVQRAVNQIVYGYRDQPEVVLRELARALDPAVGSDESLAALAGVLARSLRLPAVVLEVDGGPALRATYTAGTPDSPVEVAAAHSGGTRVTVLVSPRGPRGVTGRDRQLLGDLAPSLAATAEAVRLGRALEASRVRAVATLAEEQRRMRRDLHDGLGPVLAGLRLTIGTARRLIGTEPERADRMLADAHADAESAIGDVRRLAHDLRPPSLDELGLSDALRDRLERLVDQACTLEYTADVPSPLPAAVEVAAYRIGCEAVLNVVRHARATRCVVALTGRDGGVDILVSDDGVGIVADTAVRGVGQRSMRERAEELGGTITLAGGPGLGTTVRAFLPCGAAEEGTA